MSDIEPAPESVMPDEMFEKHYERVFSVPGPGDGIINPRGLKDSRRADIADTVSKVRPQLTERFPELQEVDPLVIDELAVYIGFIERYACESGIRVEHDSQRRRRDLDPNSAENVLRRRHELGV